MAYYATSAELKTRLGSPTGVGEAELAAANAFAQQWIEWYCGRRFLAVTATRYYDRAALDPANRKILLLDDDLLTVTTLTNANTEATVITSNQYWLWPRNETPKWGIRLKTDYTFEFDTDCFISVAGSWGYSATPDGLVKGCALRLAQWYHQSKNMVDVTTIFNDTVNRERPPSWPSDVETDLWPYRRLCP